MEIKKVKKVVLILIGQLKEKIMNKGTYPFNEIKVSEFAEKNLPHLYLFKTILVILSTHTEVKDQIPT